MKITDLVIEVRNGDFERVAQLTPNESIGLTAVVRFNNVGNWAIALPADNPKADLLREPGAGLIINGPDGVIISGPTTSAKLIQTAGNPQGDWRIEGVDDSVILGERLAYPDPTEPDAGDQATAYDEITDLASTVIYHYVDANIGPSAPIERKIPALTLAADTGLGTSVVGKARFDVIGPLITKVAAIDGLGFTIRQVDDELVFSVYQPNDLTDSIRLDVENNRLASSEFTYAAPKATRAIVAGQGEGADREIVEVSTVDSELAETAWERRIEVFKDQRDSSDTALLTQSGVEILAEDGKTLNAISVKPADNGLMRYGLDWNLGDLVSVVAGSQSVSAIVTEVGLSIAKDGVYLLATVGKPATADPENRVAVTQSKQEDRIANLERNEAGSGGGGIPGGLEGQILAKESDADFDTVWIDNYAGELRIIVKNDSGVTINKGQAVMAVGSVGDRIKVAKANADGSVSARFMLGVASEDIADSAEGYINLLGEIRNLNTSAFTVGTVLFIDPATPGALTSTEPTSPELDMSIAIVTRQHATTGIIFVRMWSQGVDLAEINDVRITSPANDELLAYNSTDGVWENQTAAEAGLLPVADPTYTGNATGNRIRLTTTTNASLSSTGHAFQIGATSSTNVIMDGNEIMARDNGAASPIFINGDGGNIGLGTSASTITLNGRLNATHYPFAMSTGTVTITPVANTLTGVAVTFPSGRFTVAPYVYTDAQSAATALTNTSHSAVSTTGATINVLRTNTTNTIVRWMAIQMTSSSANG